MVRVVLAETVVFSVSVIQDAIAGPLRGLRVEPMIRATLVTWDMVKSCGFGIVELWFLILD